jgi:hypothetical protein
MNKASLEAIHRFIKTVADDYAVHSECDCIIVHTYYSIDADAYNQDGEVINRKGRRLDYSLTIYRGARGWIKANYDNVNHCWISDDFTRGFKKTNPSAAYCCARTIDGLAGDIKTYRSAVAAIRGNWCK